MEFISMCKRCKHAKKDDSCKHFSALSRPFSGCIYFEDARAAKPRKGRK